MNRLPFDRQGVGHANGTGAGRFEPHPDALPAAASSTAAFRAERSDRVARIYAYGVSRGRLEQAAQNLGVPVQIVDTLDQANTVVTLKNYYRKHPQPIAEAERQRIPVYVLRANTINQMESVLGDIFGVAVEPEDPDGAGGHGDARGDPPCPGRFRGGGTAPGQFRDSPAATRDGPFCQPDLA